MVLLPTEIHSKVKASTTDKMKQLPPETQQLEAPLNTVERSRLMGRVRQHDTGPELAVRSTLHRLGFRFTVRGPRNRQLPGRPDIVLPRYRVVVFVHGCFWHRHPGCVKTTTPKTRTEFWEAKFSANMARDQRVTSALEVLGWRVLIVWECDTKSRPEKLSKILRSFVLKQRHSSSPTPCGKQSLPNGSRSPR